MDSLAKLAAFFISGSSSGKEDYSKNSILEYWSCLGFIALIKQNNQQAMYCAYKILNFDPKNVQAFVILGLNLEALYKMEEATHNFREVIKHQPHRQDGYACVVHCLLQSNRPAEALVIASDAVKLLTWKNFEIVFLYTVALYENCNNDMKMMENCLSVGSRALNLLEDQIGEGHFYYVEELEHRKRSDHGPKFGEDFGKNRKIVFTGR